MISQLRWSIDRSDVRLYDWFSLAHYGCDADVRAGGGTETNPENYDPAHGGSDNGIVLVRTGTDEAVVVTKDVIASYVANAGGQLQHMSVFDQDVNTTSMVAVVHQPIGGQ